MRTLVIAIAAVFLLLVSASPSPAQGFMQLVSDPLTGDYCHDAVEGQISTVYLCLWTPVNPSFEDSGERAVANVGGFECRFIRSDNLSIVSIGFPVPSIDVGTYDSHIVGYTAPVPVLDDGPYGSYVVLATLDVLFTARSAALPEPGAKSPTYCSGYEGYLTLAPTIPFSSLEGVPSFLDADDPDTPIGAEFICGFDDPCYLYFQNITVPVESASWDRVKAMYR